MVKIEIYPYHFDIGTIILTDKYYIVCNKNGKTEQINILNPKKNNIHNKKLDNNNDDDEQLEYILMGDVEFSPNSIEKNYTHFLESGVPRKEQFKLNGGLYPDNTFALGFFTAIVIFGSHFSFNLNGFEIKQSKEHYLRQRFFSIFEIGNSPFLKSLGPHDFIDTYYPASHIRIYNGKLGLSSHHGIHGNKAKSIHIHNLIIKDFEVAGIAFNGSSSLHIHDIYIPHCLLDIPVLGTWSTGLFLYPYLKELVRKDKYYHILIGERIVYADVLLKELMHIYNQVYREIIHTNKTKNLLFSNIKKLPIGTIYGIIIHQNGVAVNGFPIDNDKTTLTHELENIYIENIKANILEIPTLSSDIKKHIDDISNTNESSLQIENTYTPNNIISDVVGSVLQTQNVNTIDDMGFYKGNLISNIQLIIGKAVSYGFQFRKELSVKRNKINKEVIDWVEMNKKIVDTNLFYVFQGDNMHHVIKGIFGIRMDCDNQSSLKKIKISNIENHTEHKGFTIHDMKGIHYDEITNEDIKYIYDEYTNQKKKSHSKATLIENQMGYVRGLSIRNSNKTKLYKIEMESLFSKQNQIIFIDKYNTK